jgi:signal transduction histidine kinase
VFQRFKLQAEEKNIKITKSVSGTIHADRKGMTKVFMNLIGNAVNYIGNTSNPEIIINSSFRETDNSTLFSIKDNGIGIPADIQKEIFQKFKRGANVGGISGTGLGLSIVKGIVEAHCGKIWLESTEGEGTTFYFTLPVDLKTAPLK